MQRKFFYCGKNLPGYRPCPKADHLIKSLITHYMGYGTIFALIPDYIIYKKKYKDIIPDSDISKEQKNKTMNQTASPSYYEK
jgi:hypothetical protein